MAVAAGVVRRPWYWAPLAVLVVRGSCLKGILINGRSRRLRVPGTGLEGVFLDIRSRRFGRLAREEQPFALCRAVGGDGEEPDPEIDSALLKRAADLRLVIENMHVPFEDADWLHSAAKDTGP